MTIPSNVHNNTSEELSEIIAAVLDDDNVPQPATLAGVRQVLLADMKTITVPLNRFSPDKQQFLRDEVNALIEEYGEDALAVRFLKPRASDSLSRLIEAGMDQLGEPTLGALFQAAERGLLADLIGRGEIGDEEAQTVLAELQGLIDRHGSNALGEDFLA